MNTITLEIGKTIAYKSKNGTTYYVRNDFGDYVVWVKKSKYINGTNRYCLTDEYRKPTKEIMNHIKLEG